MTVCTHSGRYFLTLSVLAEHRSACTAVFVRFCVTSSCHLLPTSSSPQPLAILPSGLRPPSFSPISHNSFDAKPLQVGFSALAGPVLQDRKVGVRSLFRRQQHRTGMATLGQRTRLGGGARQMRAERTGRFVRGLGGDYQVRRPVPMCCGPVANHN